MDFPELRNAMIRRSGVTVITICASLMLGMPTVEFVRGYDGRIGGLVLRDGAVYAIEARRFGSQEFNR